MKNQRKEKRLKMLRETEDYLSQYLSDERIKYPRIRRHADKHASQRTEDHPTQGTALDVLIHGNLVLDLPIHLDAKLADVRTAIQEGDEKLRCDWKLARAVVGGFCAHAARAVHAAGHRVFLNSVIPLPLFKLFEDFFEEVDADTRHLVAMPGTTPASIQLQCNDGHLLIPRSGVQGQASAPLNVA